MSQIRVTTIRAVAAEERSDPLWSWRFSSPDSLREDGLEQYTAFLNNAGISRYGEWIVGEEVDGQSHMCAARKRAEIDQCMAALEYPLLRTLLDLYYRRGASCEHRGWCEVARRLGLRGDPKSRWDRDTFDHLAALAVGRLYRVHERRWQAPS